jgi:transcription elongation GreA/GreB family factor
MVQRGPETNELTAEAVERLKRTLEKLEHDERPKIVEDLSHAITLGDFSENAEYQDAKARLARIDGRIFGLKERVKNAVIIEQGPADGKIRLGSTVTVKTNGKEKTFRILGPQEADPTRGRISHLSPLGSALPRAMRFRRSHVGAARDGVFVTTVCMLYWLFFNYAVNLGKGPGVGVDRRMYAQTSLVW